MTTNLRSTCSARREGARGVVAVCTRPAVQWGVDVDYGLLANGREWACCERHQRKQAGKLRGFLLAQYTQRIMAQQ